MNLWNFNKLEKDDSKNNNFGKLVSNFIKELSNTLENNNVNEFKQEIEEIRNEHKMNNNIQELEEGKVYVITDINNEKVEVLDIKDGYNFDVYISINKETLENLHEKGINNKIYNMDKLDFLKLELGNKIIMSDGKCNIYNGEIDVKNDEAFEILENLYFNLKHEEGRDYIITQIKDGKIYMQDTQENGYYELYKEIYPNFEIGDVITKKEGKYLKK
jgi:hypothetical protein